MTDDFQLFPDTAPQDPDIDHDIALISAHLAGELSLVQIVAVEERLANDPAFRERVAPVIQGWTWPRSFGKSSTAGTPFPAAEAPLLTRAEIDAGWQRYLDRTAAAPIAGRTAAPVPRGPVIATHRKRSVARIAALIAMVALPVVAFAQAVTYAADHPGAPGHTLALRLLGPFRRSDAEPVRRSPGAFPLGIGDGPQPRRSLTAGQQAGAANAQGPTFRSISATEELRIGGADHRFSNIRVAASGTIAVSDAVGSVSRIRIFSAKGVPLATVAGGETPGLGTFEHMGGFGWLGDSVWAFSLGTVSVVSLAPAPHVVRSRPVPQETPGPPGTTPQRPQMIPYPSVVAAYSDGGLLIRQQFPSIQVRMVLGRPDLDDENIPSFLVRTSADDRFMAFTPSPPPGWHDPCVRHAAAPNDQTVYLVPLCRPPASALSPDGRSIVYARAAVPITDPATVRVTQVAIGGDTIYSREYRIPTTRVTAAEGDSIRAADLAAAKRQDPLNPGKFAITDSVLRTEMPSFRQPVSNLVIGNDGSVLLWLLRSSSEERFLLLDPRGNSIGTFTLPRGVLVLDVRPDALWGLLGKGGPPYDVVRYRIGP